MDKQTKKVNIAMLAAAVLLCLTLFTTHLVGGLYARYTATAESSDSARAARYVFDVKDGAAEQEFIIDLKEIQKPGDTASCTFTVTNANENGVCEVAQQYTVYMAELGSLPLTYRISTSDVIADWDGSEDQPMITGTLAAGAEEYDPITLAVSWPSDQTSLDFAGGVASLRIRIIAEQLD